MRSFAEWNAATGGLFKTVGGGQTWTAIDPLDEIAPIKDIVVNPDHSWRAR